MTEKPYGEVKLKIDYEIIQHFSHYLYSSPNKAVEELVSNSFDAGAQEVRVYIPGPQTKAHVIVWDDGESMDVKGIHDLWWIARSPKREGHREVAVKGSSSPLKRKVIGKFGIGKLASYAVGTKITHLCKRGNEFLIVRVNYLKLEKLGEKSSLPTTREQLENGAEVDPPVFTTPILKLSAESARRFVETMFDGEGKVAKTRDAIDSLFKRDSWTLASIRNLNSDKVSLLSVGRLNWLLGTGMPLRPDFKVYLNDELVSSKLEKNAQHTWDFGFKELQTGISNSWLEYKKEGSVEGEVQFGNEKGLDPKIPNSNVPYVEFPNLGKVFGEIRIFEDSLVKGKASSLARSHGFFIMVRGRLLNPDDDKLYIKHPSYGAFYRSQFIINADGVDSELLADREHLNKETPRTIELQILSEAVYRAARSQSESDDEKKANAIKTESLLPVKSRDYYREPLNALLAQHDAATRDQFEIDNPKVARRSLQEADQLSLFSPATGGFEINESHPLYKQVRHDFGDGTGAKKFYRFFEAFAVADRLLEGHLISVGLDGETVKHIMTWRDEQLRSFAASIKTSTSEVRTNLWNASFRGDKEFETAVAAVLEDMGFRCTRDGVSGKKDVLVAAPIGTSSYRLIFEAKGSNERWKIANDKAEVSGAASHLEKTGATHAVVIAREFDGFTRDPRANAAVLQECKTIKGDAVSIMTVEALNLLHEAMEDFHYSLDLLKDVFCEIEPPVQKIERIRKLHQPMDDFPYRDVIEEIWQRQNGEAYSEAVPYGSVRQQHAEWKQKFTPDDFDARLQALDTLSGGRITLNTTQQTVFLLTSPDHLLEFIRKNLADLAALKNAVE